MKAVSRFLLPLGLTLTLFCGLLALSIAPAGAAGGVSGTLRGNVVDQQTGRPISDAKVTAVSGSGTYR
ncbi:MAG TPA: hypothetical protein VGQ96_01900, partial [Candidatus Eremiobacteraceae bacterium]|nr:hypothetical protein [Candidatus Eremiobacteraceae bacterium]